MKKQSLKILMCSFGLLAGALQGSSFWERLIIVHNATDTSISASVFLDTSTSRHVASISGTDPQSHLKTKYIDPGQTDLLMKIACNLFIISHHGADQNLTIIIKNSLAKANLTLSGISEICPNLRTKNQSLEHLKITVEKNEAGELILSTDKQFEVPQSLLATERMMQKYYE